MKAPASHSADMSRRNLRSVVRRPRSGGRLVCDITFSLTELRMMIKEIMTFMMIVPTVLALLIMAMCLFDESRTSRITVHCAWSDDPIGAAGVIKDAALEISLEIQWSQSLRNSMVSTQSSHSRVDAAIIGDLNRKEADRVVGSRSEGNDGKAKSSNAHLSTSQANECDRLRERAERKPARNLKSLSATRNIVNLQQKGRNEPRSRRLLRWCRWWFWS